VPAPGPLYLSTLAESEPARVGPQTARTMLNADWPALFASLLPSRQNLCDLLFGDFLGALQVLARTAGCLALPTPRDAFLTALAKSALPPRVEAMSRHKRSRRRTPRLTGRLTLGLAGSGSGSRNRSGAGSSPRNFTCLRALVAAAMFLAGTLGPSWFAVLEGPRMWISSLQRTVRTLLVQRPWVPTPVRLLVCQASVAER